MHNNQKNIFVTSKLIDPLNAEQLCCSQKAVNAATEGHDYEAQLWGFMKIMFESNSRVEILNYLGFDKEGIAEKVASYPLTLIQNLDDSMEILVQGEFCQLHYLIQFILLC